MQPHDAIWEPHPQPLRTNVMTAAGCGRTDGNGVACALIDDDASTPQMRTNDNDNLLNIEKTPYGCVRTVLYPNTNYTAEPLFMRKVFLLYGSPGIAFALYVALVLYRGPNDTIPQTVETHFLDLHKTYGTFQACDEAAGELHSSPFVGDRRDGPQFTAFYYCAVPGE